MALFNDNFYTKDFDQEMLDWIGSNHSRYISHIEGEWDAEGTKLEYYRGLNYFWTSNVLGGIEELTKEQFKEKIGMPKETVIPLSEGDYTTRKEIKAYAEEQGITLKQAYQRICDAFVTSGALEKEGIEYYHGQALSVYGWNQDTGGMYFASEVRVYEFTRHLTPEQIIGAPQEEAQEQSETNPEPRLISSFSYTATVGEASMHLDAEDITIEDAIALLQEIKNDD